MAAGSQSSVVEPKQEESPQRSQASGDQLSTTTTTYHELLDGFLVEISGEGGRSVDQLRDMYGRHGVAEPDREPDIRVELHDDEPDPDVVLGWPDSHYGRDGDRFVIGVRGSFLTVDAEWQHLAVSPDWEPYHIVYVIEFELRRRLAPTGWALLHGCGFQFNEEAILCPSLRGAGKTNTLLSVLQSGGAYLSDDRVWVNSHGRVRGYPIPINLHTEQYQSFPDLTTSNDSLRARVADVVDGHVDRDRSFLDKVVSFLCTEFLVEDGRSFQDIDDLLPDATYVPEAKIDRLALLRAAPNRSDIEVEDLSDEALARALRMIHHYEWDARLTEYFLAFDALFPDGEKSTHIDQVQAGEMAVFRDLIGSLPSDLIKVPRERNWQESGVSEDILETFETLTLVESQPS